MSPPGIWRHAALFDDGGAPAELAARRGWSLGEGDTPLQDWPALAAELGLDRVLLKREDLNPGGSHKDRGLLYQVVAHRSESPDAPLHYVLSSSGNAAVSASAACRVTGGSLLAFVAPGTAASKYERLMDSGARVVVSDKPINYARYAGRVFGLTDLRGTKDPRSPIGYRSLAGELADVAPDAVLTFSSSGTSMTGILDGFAALGRAVACVSVQAGVCLGIARALDPDLPDEPDNPAGRLGIRNPPDADALAARLAATGGGAVAVTAGAVRAMAERLAARPSSEGGPLRVSPEGAAVLAAVADLARAGRLRGTVVAIVTGHGSQWRRPVDGQLGGEPLRVDSYLALRDALLAEGLETV